MSDTAAPRYALVVMGTSGAGKSHIGTLLADALHARFVEGDAFHPPRNIALMAAGVPLTDDDRAGWLRALAAQLRTARDDGGSVVLACSALRRRYRDVLRDGDDSAQFILLSADATLLRERLTSRSGHFMPASLLESQLATLEPPAPDERAWTLNAGESPDAIVSEIIARLAARLEQSRR